MSNAWNVHEIDRDLNEIKAAIEQLGASVKRATPYLKLSSGDFDLSISVVPKRRTVSETQTGDGVCLDDIDDLVRMAAGELSNLLYERRSVAIDKVRAQHIRRIRKIYGELTRLVDGLLKRIDADQSVSNPASDL